MSNSFTSVGARNRTRLGFEKLEDRCNPAFFFVNTTADDANSFDANIGEGTATDDAGRVSLRSAIQEANFNVGADTIEFDLPRNSTISLNTALPTITTNIAIGYFAAPNPKVGPSRMS